MLDIFYSESVAKFKISTMCGCNISLKFYSDEWRWNIMMILSFVHATNKWLHFRQQTRQTDALCLLFIQINSWSFSGLPVLHLYIMTWIWMILRTEKIGKHILWFICRERKFFYNFSSKWFWYGLFGHFHNDHIKIEIYRVIYMLK